ncbi:hypothetical protein SAMN03159338_1511 [Sphingomonas sp. NFR04]|uniref:hypothetical protein n=1 Tax=Sphingomonas sp. NFR04 TaxID=1566283 RepID=UPI0008F008A9|nr:hypothetical protein [Sphingomonas sp. NFR04]SFJ48034.1 hypothetical protein SAMN03159338_1511 [Sphingomonas sp. NFR04]
MPLRTIAQILDERLKDESDTHGGANFTLKVIWNGDDHEVEMKLHEVLADGLRLTPAAEKQPGEPWPISMSPFTAFDMIRIVEQGQH